MVTRSPRAPGRVCPPSTLVTSSTAPCPAGTAPTAGTARCDRRAGRAHGDAARGRGRCSAAPAGARRRGRGGRVADELDARCLDRARRGGVRIGGPGCGRRSPRRWRCRSPTRRWRSVWCAMASGRPGGGRRGRVARRALRAATLGGLTALAVLLAGAYAVQVAPAIWTVWRTPSPTGVAAATWSLVGVEGALWCVYGLHHDDPAVTSFGIIAMVAAAATLARKATTARAPTPSDEPRRRGPDPSTMSRITVP